MTAAAPTPPDVRLAAAAACCWATVAVVLTAPVPAGWAVVVGWAVTATAAAATARRWRGRSGPNRAVALTIAAAAVLACGLGTATALRAHQVRTAPITELVGDRVTVELAIGADPASIRGPGPERVIVRATVTAIDTGPRRRAANAPVTVFAPAEEWASVAIGQKVRAEVTVAKNDRADLTAVVLRARGAPQITAEAGPLWRGSAMLRTSVTDRAAALLAPEEAALLPGLLLGDTAAMDEQVRERFAIAGLTHLTAVSGTHFALVCAAAALLVSRLGPRPRAITIVAVTIGFVILVRPAPSVLRAATMGLIAVYALLSGRSRQALPALAAAVIVLLVAVPDWAIAPGFVMSVGATAALVLIAPTWADRLRGTGVPGALAEAIAVAAAAQLAVLPMLATISGYVGVAAIPANIAAIPAVAPALLLGLAAALLGPWWPLGADVAIRLAGPALWWIGAVARWAAGLPGAGLAVPVGGVGVAIVCAGIAATTVWMSSAAVRRVAVVAAVGFAAVWVPVQAATGR